MNRAAAELLDLERSGGPRPGPRGRRRTAAGRRYSVEVVEVYGGPARPGSSSSSSSSRSAELRAGYEKVRRKNHGMRRSSGGKNRRKTIVFFPPGTSRSSEVLPRSAVEGGTGKGGTAARAPASAAAVRGRILWCPLRLEVVGSGLLEGAESR